MNEIARVNGNRDITTWTKQDAQKAAQLGSVIGPAGMKLAQKLKDPSLIAASVDQCLLAQRDFVVWWDAQEKEKGGRGKTSCRSASGLLEDYGLNESQVSRWRSKFIEHGRPNDEKFERYRCQVMARCMKAVGLEIADNHRAQGTGENEWYTPPEYIEIVRNFLGDIDLDPASNKTANKTVKANEFYGLDVGRNGLELPWRGRVWMNPPYSQPAIQQFMQKAADEFSAGNVTEAVLLTHNYTDTAWFHIGARAASAICFTRGRIGFVNQNGEKAAPTQGQAFFYLGCRPEAFANSFSAFGFVVFLPKI